MTDVCDRTRGQFHLPAAASSLCLIALERSGALGWVCCTSRLKIPMKAVESCAHMAKIRILLAGNVYIALPLGMDIRTSLISAAGLVLFMASCSVEGTAQPGSGGNQGIDGSGGSGSLSCSSELLSCGSTCVNAQTNFQNCGTCGEVCGLGQSCAGGACQCTGGLSACASGCVNLVSGGNNCGDCETVCEGGLVCSQSTCSDSCASGETACGNSCVNTLTDATNCGFCENQCAGGQACSNGACTCPEEQATCSGVCVDVQTDPGHCGTCSIACETGQSCEGGVCSGGGDVGSGGAAATGGSTGAGGGAVVEGRNDCVITPGMIADFEEGDAIPVVIKSEDRTGEWEIFNDGRGTNQMMSVAASGGTEACDKYALHVTGSGYSDWGAGFGFSLVGPTASPTTYNAATHTFTGIRFKAKVGSGHDPKSPVRFNVSTPWTENSENPGGTCKPVAATDNKAAVDCYQHMGKFLPPGSGANELTTQWKTYDFCFDRDLYPLSLPSNLTNSQRSNIASSILKVQFQFNQGKDYSGAYTETFPLFAKSLPFDLWVDDLEFFSGDCPSAAASPSNGSPAKPFPQNANIGSCTPATGAPLFASAIADAYARWTSHFVQNDHIVAPEQNGTVTSEALGYGMLIAAAMGDKAAFDKFHGYVKSNGGTGSGLMTWKNGGSGSASDGDIDIAYALLMANKQWPSGGYKTAADNMASAILSQDLVSNVIRGGSQFKDAPFNPSYFAPAAFRAFGSSFAGALSSNYTLVTSNVTATTAGVPTDWANPSSGAPSGPGSAQVTSEIIDGNNGAMGYDSARVPWRLALDVCLGGGNTTALKAIVDFFAAKYDAGASIDLMKAGWYKTNGQVHTSAQDSQGSYIGPIGAGAMAMNNTVMKDRAFHAILDILESGDFNHTYFPSTVGLLTLLMMSGNFPTP